MNNKLFLLFLMLMWNQVFATQHNETTDAGNTMPTAQLLPPGTTSVAGQISDVFDVDLFEFDPFSEAASYTIGGTVTGLLGSGLVLQNNAGDDLVINANGSFTFATQVDHGDTYDVTVKTQPTVPDQFCRVTRGSGTASGTTSDFTIEVPRRR
jgi:hypothetical protein